jgi:imidazolonepropionase-like amidohydrolase
MRTLRTLSATAAALAATILAAPIGAVGVPGYAILGAKIVTVRGATIDRGTVVIRNGIVESVSDNVKSPGGVEEIDGKGLVVYPGLVDLNTTAGIDQPQAEAPKDPESREVSERWRRQQLVHADLSAADFLRPESPELAKLTGLGVTNALVVPKGDGISGESAFIDVAPPEIDPQYGRVAVDPRGPMILKTPVALHVSFPGRGLFGAYPASLMGGIAFTRQAFLDAQRYKLAASKPDATGDRPAYDPALTAMANVMGSKLPVAFEANSAREIRRVLAFAKDFSLDPIVVGGVSAGDVTSDLKAAGARVIVSLNYPERSKTLAPDADEPLEDIQARADARRAAGQLAAAGVPFGFGSHGLRDVKDFLPNVRAAVSNGLSADAAVKALTLDAATIAGMGSKLGAIEKGRIANLVVTDGELLGPKTKVKYVFVEGRRLALP